MTMILLAALAMLAFVRADTPVYCPWDVALGDWTFYVTAANQTANLACPTTWPTDLSSYTPRVLTLQTGGVALDEAGNVGTWTSFSSQGFEVRVAGYTYFTYFDYSVAEDGTVTSYCSRTQPGRATYHEDRDHAPRFWGCMYGQHHDVAEPRVTTYRLDEMENRTLLGHELRFWGPRGIAREVPTPSKELTRFRADYPESFDWRDVDGVNYVGPMRDQLSCGSCYAYAGVQVMESRLRIASQMAVDVYLSEQDIVSCSPYSEGCNGGFDFCVSKYAHDFGVTELRAFGYQIRTVPCDWGHWDKGDYLHYAKDYYYVGGYFMQSNEELIMEELYNNGPVAVSINADDGFSAWVPTDPPYYAAPQYTEDGMPVTNHAVNVVGWGVEDGVNYWILRNSWGTSWGESGYMRVERGRNSMGLEEQATAAIMLV